MILGRNEKLLFSNGTMFVGFEGGFLNLLCLIFEEFYAIIGTASQALNACGAFLYFRTINVTSPLSDGEGAFVFLNGGCRNAKLILPKAFD